MFVLPNIARARPWCRLLAIPVTQTQRHHTCFKSNHASVRAVSESAVDGAVLGASRPVLGPPKGSGVTYRAHIDFKYVVENLETVKENVKKRMSSADPERVVELYERCNELGRKTDALRAARNENAKAMKGKVNESTRQELITAGQELKEQIAALEEVLRSLEGELQLEAQRLPNMTHPEVPVGGEEAAAVVVEVGSKQERDFQVKNHVDVMEALDLIDFDSAAAVSGSKFYYLKNAAALLEMALVNYAMQKCVAHGFTPLMTPDLVRASVLEKCGFQPRVASTQTYSVWDTDLCLTGTAEVPLGGMYMDKVVEEGQLPVRLAGFGRCFRTEAGAAGAAGKGLYRVHQFSKVEMFVVCTPEQSEALLRELLDIEMEMFTELGLHYKLINMPTGDLGAPAYCKFDVEAWMPGLGRYGEVSSASNCTDYQARRLNIRYRVAASGGGGAEGEPARKKKKGAKARGSPTAFCHTLNATACAVPRMLVAIMENFQRADGSVEVPAALRQYMGGLEVIRR